MRAEITLISLPPPRMRETDVKQSPRIRASESMQPSLARTMADILQDQQWIVEEDLLGFSLAHVMFFDAFAIITFVPFKPLDLREIEHFVYYRNIR